MHVLTGMQRRRHGGRFARLLLAGTTLALMAVRAAPSLVAPSERPSGLKTYEPRAGLKALRYGS